MNKNQTLKTVSIVVAVAIIVSIALSFYNGGLKESPPFTFIATPSSTTPSSPPPFCGDEICNNEDLNSCPNDCTTPGDIVYLSQVTQHGITFYFHDTHTLGKFANGDWWVLAPLTIDRMTPDFEQYNFYYEDNNGEGHNEDRWINGAEINPSDPEEHGFDERADSFELSRVPKLPYTASTIQSIVKVDSLEESHRTLDQSGPNCRGGVDNERTCVWSLFILTVVEEIPKNNGATIFRPAYAGNNKVFHSINELKPELLPSLHLDDTSNIPTLDWVEDKFSCSFFDHKYRSSAERIKPASCLDHSPYNGYISRDREEAILRLMLDDSIEAKMPALIQYTQQGIDLYYSMLEGSTWPANGGHGIGRKIPILFTAILLENKEMKDNIPGTGLNTFQEEGIIYNSPVNNVPLFGELSNPEYHGEESYWKVAATGSGHRTLKDPYNQIDGGISGWIYQFCCNSIPMKGTSLTLLLMPEMLALWGEPHVDHFIEYVERWVSSGAIAQPDTCAPAEGICENTEERCTTANSIYYDGPDEWRCQSNETNECIIEIADTSKYGVTYGPKSTNSQYCMEDNSCECIQDKDDSDGIGRFPQLHNINIGEGSYGTNFAGNMWNQFHDEHYNNYINS